MTESIDNFYIKLVSSRRLKKRLKTLPLKDRVVDDNRSNISSKSAAIDMCANTALDLRNLTSLSRDELHQILLKQSEARLKSDREYDVMREALEQQVRKEMVYREEMAKQLHLVRGTFCQQLDNNNWKSRLTVHHKINESEENLMGMSCKAKEGPELGGLKSLHHYNDSH